MNLLLLATIGGLVSALSTSLGAGLAPLMTRFEKLRKFHMSMDFALGVMLSAVAFSLVGPEILKGNNQTLVFGGLLAGSVFIYLTHNLIEFFTRGKNQDHYKILLVAALIFHNLPEGMGAGASLAGMSLSEALPLQVAIALQNVVEGLLLTLLLRSLGLKLTRAVWGGVASGLLEMSGGVLAGVLMQQTLALLPFLLSLAGGSMMMSVILEMKESFIKGKRIAPGDFLTGVMVIPLTNLLLG